MMRLLFIAALAAACMSSANAAEDLTITDAEPLVRPGVLWRCTVRGSVDPGPGAGPLVLTVSLVAGSLVLAAAEVPLPDALALRTGVAVVLAPSGALPAELVPEVRARLASERANGERPVIARTVRMLADPGDLTRRATAAVARLVSRTQFFEPLPRLLAEEFAELAVAEPGAQGSQPSTLRDEQTRRQLVEQLESWPVPSVTTTRLAAFTDPVDGSVQPLRITTPAQSAAGAPLVLLVHANSRATAKVRWPVLPTAWLAAAATAGVTVCEVYPAGDLTFTGVTRHRIALAEAAARRAEPTVGASLTIVAHAGLSDPAAWRRAAPLPPEPHPRGRLAAWASGPFVIVVGSGEHAAAVADAQHLAQEFRTAWANHAQGLPPMISDRDFRPADWPGHHLVLVGSPRCNRVTAGLTLPLTWDDRLVTWNGHFFHRSYLPGIALALPQAQHPQLTVLVLDGAPRWQAAAGELPFASEAQDADLVIEPGAEPGPEPERRAIRVLLESPTTRP